MNTPSSSKGRTDATILAAKDSLLNLKRGEICTSLIH
jgi:hypothetical protein